jgi:hypothetical protein
VNNQLINNPVDCGSGTACVTVTCDKTNGCTSTPVPDPNPGTYDPCNPRVCDPKDGWKNQPVICTTTDPCKPSTCSNGACVVNPVLCGNPNDLCDTSVCSNGVCTGTRKTCTVPDACQIIDPLYTSTSGCNPSTGTCSFKPKTCVSTNCFDQQCINGACQEVPTQGCSANCVCSNDVCTKTPCDTTTFQCGTPVAVDCVAKKPDSCSIAAPCDPVKGCTYTTINCTAQAAPDKCSIMVADTSDPNCCVAKPINCNKGNPCKSYTCDKITNGCQETDLCVQGTDKCTVIGCGPSGCTSTVTTCTAPNKCFTSQCDSSTGKCTDTPISCDDSDPCTVDSCDPNQGCLHTPIVCTPSDKCSTSVCSNGQCVNTAITCDDSVACTKDTCDPLSGCQFTPDNTYCNSPDPCLKTSCDAVKGCISSAVPCPATGLRCSQSTCVAYQGCANISLTCNKTQGADACVYTSCSEDKTLATPCKEEQLVCGVPIDDTQTIVAAAVGSASAAIIAGVICAVAVATGVVGGAAVAIYRQGDDDGMVNISNNPLFVASDQSGTNPLAAAV